MNLNKRFLSWPKKLLNYRSSICLNWLVFLGIAFLLSWSCAPHFHFDLLGEEKLKEVTLVPRPTKNKILVVDVSGFIGTNLNPSLFQRETNLVASVSTRLEKARQDKDIRAIILRLDSPGGEVTAANIIYEEIKRFRQDTGKPVVALALSLATSGAYYIAAACDSIIAHPSTITGSIGVISLFPDIHSLLEKIGIKVNVIKSGRHKDSGSPFRPLSQEEERLFQNIIDELYQQFLEVVLQGRQGRINRQKLLSLADGRIFTTSQALAEGLIDKIGYFQDALKEALRLSGLQEARVVTLTYYPKRKNNIYSLANFRPLLKKEKEIIPLWDSLHPGFYYLWLPSWVEKELP